MTHCRYFHNLQGQLLEIRALMLERLGRHREALSVYVHDLGAMPLAEEYCDRVYEAGLAATTAATAAAPGYIAAAGGGSSSAAAAAVEGNQEGAEAAESAAGPGADEAGAAKSANSGSSSSGSTFAPPWSLHRRIPSSSSKTAGMLHNNQLPAGSPASTGRLAGAAAGSNWGKVLPGKLQQQQARQNAAQQQQQRRRGRRALLGQGGRRTWAAMPFGSKPHDIYMELVDAVIQVGVIIMCYLYVTICVILT
jgi:hypothetical protein